jgi:predicted nucleic acid-binding protein
MILVDTSVWIDHLRRSNPGLESLLLDGEVLAHAFVAGELACGDLSNRAEILSLLEDLPRAPLAEHEEVMRLVDHRHLWGHGVGWINMHLLASTLLARCAIWTLDGRLARVASSLGLAHE